MGKKMKKNTKDTNRNVDGKNVPKKKKQKGQDGKKHTPAVVGDQNLKFKSKHKKNTNQLPKKLKQIHKMEGGSISASLVNSDVAKVINIKSKARITKTDLLVKNENKQHKVIGRKPHKQKKRPIEQNSDRSNKTNNITEKSKKKRNGPQLSDANKVQDSKHAKNKKKGKQKAKNETAPVNSVLQKKKKKEQKNKKTATKFQALDIKRLEEMLVVKRKQTRKEKENEKPRSLREQMMTKLRASRFRYLNETLYNSDSSESKKYFKDDPDAFTAYHYGYKQQVGQWPLNPLDVIISSIKKMPKEYVVADFGCGEARLAASVTHKVHSFDFVSLNDNVTACDMAHTPLLTNGVHVVVFCLSLMGTNLKDYIIEANRVLKKDGILKIAEVESRFDQVEDFIKILGDYGFKNTWKDLSHNLFYFLDFKKLKDVGNKKSKLNTIALKPCLYKKR